MKHHFLALTLALTATLHAVPTEIARESFEGTGIGFTTSVPQFIEVGQGNLFSDFFSVLPNNGTKISGNRTLPGADGANIFAAEDCDTPRTLPALAGPQEVTLTTNAVNIAGKTNTQVRLLMAAPGRSDGSTVTLGEYENFSNGPLHINKLIVEASIDNGPFQRVVQFSPTVKDASSQQLTYDADGNNTGGDANPISTNPTTLDDTLREGIYSIPTGGTVRIRLTFETDATGELICFDNIRIFGESSATAAPVLAGVPATALVFTEGGAATAIAPTITATDADSANLASATVAISQNYVNGQDVLTATPSGAIVAGDIVFNAATGTLTITRNATKAAYQAVLQSVSYRNTNTSAPSTATRRVTFQTSDGTNLSNSPTRDITVVDAIVTQSLPFVESWETDGQGTRYAVEGGFSSPPDLFARFQPTTLANIDGSFAWGVQNVDNNSDFTELITFNLNTAGLVNLMGELRVAAGSGAVYDTGDFLRVEASADGGAFQNVLAFYPESGFASLMRQDTTPANTTDVGDGTVLTGALQNFTFALPTATTLTVRIRAFTNITEENITFDRLAVSGQLPPIIVTNTNDANAGSLRAAIAAAQAQPGASTITFHPTLSGETISLTSGELVITDPNPVLIDASAFDSGITLSGNSSNRILRAAAGSTVTLQRLHLREGNGVGGGSPANYGGAIYNQATLMLTECSITACAAFAGGAIYNTSNTQTLTLNRCTLASNAASHGGAIQNEGTLAATNTTFTQNTASQNGGAISSPFGRPATLIHCTMVGNTAALQGGGGIGTGFALTNSIVAGNTPDNINGTHTLTGTNLTTGDPKLAPLANNGGPTRTRHPLLGSPARDRITTTSTTTDQRGLARSQWGASDIGAVEAGILADCAWEVRDVWTSPATTLGNLANVDAMLANPAALQATGVAAVINFNDLNGVAGGGYFLGDRGFLGDNQVPQGITPGDDNQFATQARAYLTITTAGDYTFGFASDDGARLRLFSTTGGADPVFTSSTSLTSGNPNNPAHSGNTLTFNTPTGDSATLGVANLAPGVYGVELTVWEDTGGAFAEMFFATGAQTTLAGNTNFYLLGGNFLTRTPGISRPFNDDFADAITLSGAVVHTVGCNTGATMQLGEPSGNFHSQSVWFTWTAPATTGYQIDTIGSSYDTQLAIFTGTSLGGLTQVAFNDDAEVVARQSLITLAATAGATYYIQLSNYDNRDGSTFLLNIGPPPNQMPSFTKGANQSVLTNAGAQSIPGWATAINAGSTWETSQTLNFIVTTTNGSLFVSLPAVSPDGTLSYVPAPTAGGTATVSVQIVDNGVPPLISEAQEFTITTSLAPTVGTPLTINVGAGATNIIQDFNTAGSTSVNWVDNSTVPGWYAQINDAATASGVFQPSNGTAALNGLINCGSTTTPTDRSLGSKATSTGGFANISYAVVMRNVGNLPVKLSRLRYAEELWRSGAGASMQEKVTTFYAISDAPLANIASGTSNATAAAGAGFTAFANGANTQIASTTINTALDGNLAANRSSVDFSPVAGDLPAILPGQYFTVKWTDTNEASFADGHQAIDDVTLDFTEVPCAIYAAVSNVRRNFDGNTGSTDTVDFTLTVAGAGSGLSASGWVIAAPAAFASISSSYGSPRVFTGIPLSEFATTPVLTIRDIADAGCTATASVPLPLVLGINLEQSTVTYIQASFAPAIYRQTQLQGPVTHEVTFDPGASVLTTDAIALTPGPGKVISLTIEATDTSTNSGFETDDTVKVELISTLPDGTQIIDTLSHDADINTNGVINGGATPLADEFNLEQKPLTGKWTSTFTLLGEIPSEATGVRLRISAAILGNVAATTTEVFRFKNAFLRTGDGEFDSDGIRSYLEQFIHGTNPNNAASRFGPLHMTANGGNVGISVPTGNIQARTYQLLTSPDLLNWTRDGQPILVPGGNGPWTPLQLTRPRALPKNFYKVLVQQPQVDIP